MLRIYFSKPNLLNRCLSKSLAVLATCGVFLMLDSGPAVACDVNHDGLGTFTVGERSLRLAGIEGDWAPLMDDKTLNNFFCDGTPEPVYQNRYGQDVVLLENNGRYAQEHILKTYPFMVAIESVSFKGDDAFYTRLKTSEQTARLKQNPERVRSGDFGIVQGRLTAIKQAKKVYYLNFGEDWKTDFTVLVDVKDYATLVPADLTVGDVVTVRGWVEDYYGPMIKITHPAQIDLD